MPCESCSVQFTVFKRKKLCYECYRYYCSNCIGKGLSPCEPCKILCNRPTRSALDRLRVRDLQSFLHRQNISTRGCVEKEDLINLVLIHANNGNFKKRPPTDFQSDFSATLASLRGFTNNVNSFLSSAFDIGSNNGERSSRRQQFNNSSQNFNQQNVPNATRSSTQSEPRRQSRPESTPSSAIPTPQSHMSPRGRSPVEDERGFPEEIVNEELREEARQVNVDNVTTEHPHRNTTTDCIEIEDIDEEWEVLGHVGDPLPQDSEELIADAESPIPLRSSARARSEINLSSSYSTIERDEESSSLNESKFHHPPNLTGRVQLNDLKQLSDVEKLTVKQLKELLMLNRVDFKGCCERNELLERATRLWTESTKSREDIDKAPLEELCKICMDAPMECVMLECGHIATCTTCGKRLSECPICRQYVVRVVRFFKS